MLFMVCPTCGELLGNKELLYINLMKSVCEEMGIDDDIMSQGTVDKDPVYIAKRQKIIQDLCKNICCRMRMISYIDLVQIIK